MKKEDYYQQKYRETLEDLIDFSRDVSASQMAISCIIHSSLRSEDDKINILRILLKEMQQNQSLYSDKAYMERSQLKKDQNLIK